MASNSSPVWPDWMPAPQQDSWNFQLEDLREATETEVGAIIRPQFDSDILIADCTLVLNRMQSAWFEAFEKLANHDCIWFVFPVWYGGLVRDGVVMFKDRPKWTVEALTTTYKFAVLVQKRSLELDPCIIEMLNCWTPCEVILIADDILDAIGALNGSTTPPGELGPCIIEMLNCWNPCDAIDIGEYVVESADALDGCTILPSDIGE